MSWDAPANLGNDVLVPYKLFIQKDTDSEAEYSSAPAHDAVSFVVTGIEKGSIYAFKLYAVNAQGASDNYAEVTDVTLQKPGEVIFLTDEIHPTYILLEWEAPTSVGDNEISKYKVSWTVNGESGSHELAPG